jgi:hypothetical protein|nr:MAG TPA: hypothetical protein [Caudoviricetes sp.]
MESKSPKVVIDNLINTMSARFETAHQHVTAPPRVTISILM